MAVVRRVVRQAIPAAPRVELPATREEMNPAAIPYRTAMNNNSCARVRSPRHIWDVSGCDSSSETLARSISINTPAVMAIRSTSGHIKLDVCHIIRPAPTAVENVSAILPPRRPNEASRSSTRFTDQKAIAATPIPTIIIALAARKAKKPPTAFAVCGQVIHRITGETIPAVIPNDKTATPAGDFMSCAPGMASGHVALGRFQ